MRRTLRRNQATTRPPPSRTRLSSPRSYAQAYASRFYVRSSLSKRRTPLQLGLLSPHAQVISHCGILQEDIGRCIFRRIETVRCLAPISISLFKSFHCGRRFRGIHTTNQPGISTPFRYSKNHVCILLAIRTWHFSIFCGQLL